MDLLALHHHWNNEIKTCIDVYPILARQHMKKKRKSGMNMEEIIQKDVGTEERILITWEENKTWRAGCVSVEGESRDPTSNPVASDHK